MKFIQGHIYGYGKYLNASINFHKGFQIIYGEDEGSKTTIFNFLLDMLFGQRISKKRNAPFTENYYSYIPWNTHDYRGNLTYLLENGVLIHIHRTFGPEPSIRVMEGTNMRDITDTFPVYPNREIGFSKVHFGVNREIFSGVATINSKTMVNWGGPDNGNEVREHLLWLMDTGIPYQSIQMIINSLKDYLDNIGTVRSDKKPINILEEQLVLLAQEEVGAREINNKIREIKYQIKKQQEQVDILHKEILQIENKIKYAKQYSLWRRKNDAKALQEKLNDLTSRMFASKDYKYFPVEQKMEVVQCETTVSQCERQKQKIQMDIEQVTEEINELELKLREISFVPIDYITSYQERFEKLKEQQLKIESTLDDLNNQYESLKKQIEEKEHIISEYPKPIQERDDFYEEVESTINLYRNSVNETKKSEEELKIVEQKIVLSENGLKPLELLFENVSNLPELIEDYWRYKNKPEEEQRELENHFQRLEYERKDALARKPIEILLSAVCFLLGLSLLYIFITTHKTPSLLFFISVCIGFIYFFKSFLDDNKMLKEITCEQKRIREKINKIISYEYIKSHPITILMDKAELQHPRELEGLYDQYLARKNIHEELLIQLKKVEELLFINQTRTSLLFSRLQKYFEEANIPLESEEQIEPFREVLYRQQEMSKYLHRKLWDLKENLQRLTDNILRKKEFIYSIERQIQDEIYNRIGKEFIKMGILKLDEPISQETFKSYYQVDTFYHDLQTKVSELRKKRLALHEKLKQSEEEQLRTEQRLQELLDFAEVKDISEWKKKCKLAEEARELFSKIEQTEKQLQLLLGDNTLNEIEQQVGDFVPNTPAENEQELLQLLEQKKSEFESLTQCIHSLRDELNELKGKTRPLNEIMDEKGTIEIQIQTLKKEREAVLFAISLLQQLTLEQYNKLIPLLKKEMSVLFHKLTNGKYSEVQVEPDLTIKVFASETNNFVPIQKHSLSQGTLEQLYLSIRVALIRIMSYQGEYLPILLNDPFSSYDLPQLHQALITLKTLGENHQILLFSCRNDILDSASKLNIPVVKIG